MAAYLEDYEVLRCFAGNHRGTYFGRICEYPHPDESTTPQLLGLIAKLNRSYEGQRRRAVYEVNIYAEHKDANVPRGFPCMAHLSFQLGGEASDRLDCVAHYRSQDLIAKGYGNYLGLAELQQYLAATTGFAPGELMVVAGNASLSGGIAALRQVVDGLT